MTQDSNWRSTGFVVFVSEHATNRRLHTERCVVVPRNSLSVCDLRLTVSNEIQSDISKREYVGHWSLLLAQALVSLVGERGAINDSGLFVEIGASVVAAD